MEEIALLVPVLRMDRDAARAAETLSDTEARFLVDAYYQMQENRIRADGQVRSMSKDGEPHAVLSWLGTQSEAVESQIKRALARYAESKPLGQWALSQIGIGPVITAGLLAHISFNPWVCVVPKEERKPSHKCTERAPCTEQCRRNPIQTVGHLWRFAGLDPTTRWEKGQKRLWNASLKTLCCHPSTMVMTDTGAKEISQIAVGDMVLTHKARFRRVKAVHTTTHAGTLVGVRSYGNSAGPLFLTDNHPIYTEIRLQWAVKKDGDQVSFRGRDRVLRSGSLPDEQIRVMREQRSAGVKLTDLADQYGCSVAAVSTICAGKRRTRPMQNERMWVRADGIQPGWLLSTPRLPHGPMQSLVTQNFGGKAKRLPESVEIDAEMARLFGLFFAEGHVSKNRVGFAFHRNEIEYQSFVTEALIRRFGLSIVPQVHDNSWQGIVSSKAFAAFMATEVGTNSFNMRVPAAVLHGPVDVKAAFLRGVFEGDGCLNERTLALTTSSVPHDIHALLNSIGIACTISPYQRSFKVYISNEYQFDQTVFGGDLGFMEKRSALARVEPEAVWTQARESLVTQYAGPLFNLEVEEDESYVANGIAVHNCWKIGESFVKVSGNPSAFYGRIYTERKAYEQRRNERGELADQAASALKAKRFGADTQARKYYESGRLPPAHIHARAKRYAVKLFLAHYFEVGYGIEHGKAPPSPYPIAILGHADKIEPPR